jgi:uncharacterized protein
MRMKQLVATAALAALAAMSSLALAQTPAASSPAKKQLVAKVLEIQRPGIEALANNVAVAPVMQMRQAAGTALQQAVPPERREAVAREIEGDMRAYVEDVSAALRQQALRIAPATLGTILEERFTEEELRQLIALLESPINKKFQSLAGEMQRSIGERLVGESRATVEPKLRELERTVAGRLGLQQPADAPRN